MKEEKEEKEKEEGTQPVAPIIPEGDVIPVLRRRPLVYIYDLPRTFTTDHLEVRTACTPRGGRDAL